MRNFFRFMSRHPWIYVVLAFVLLIASWAALILVAARNPIQEFEVAPPTHHR
ncbi:MAG: hypothetical protein WCJ66_00170 [Verrucomicrobiota bacterium]